jgi:hypothetical protein
VSGGAGLDRATGADPVDRLAEFAGDHVVVQPDQRELVVVSGLLGLGEIIAMNILDPLCQQDLLPGRAGRVDEYDDQTDDLLRTAWASSRPMRKVAAELGKVDESTIARQLIALGLAGTLAEVAARHSSCAGAVE